MKNSIRITLLIIGISSLVLCAAVGICQIMGSISLYGRVQLSTENDYQKFITFRESMSNKLNTFLEIANGTYLDWDYIEKNYNSDYSYEFGYLPVRNVTEVSEAVKFAEDLSAMSDEEYSEFLIEQDENGYHYPNREYSKDERQKMAEYYLKYQKADRNLLYQITKADKVLFTNLEGDYTYGDSLPDGYNYLMYFDGQKVSVWKDGKQVDVYGDGIYDGNEDYEIPGYSNYIASEDLKDVTIAMMAIKTPMQYRVVGGDEGTYYYGTAYTIYQEMIRLNNGYKELLILAIAGVLTFLLSLFFKGDAAAFREKLAVFLNKIWIEPKIIFALAILYGIINSFSFWNVGHYVNEFLYSFDGPGYRFNAFGEILLDNPNLFVNNPIFVLLAFWILYLFIFEIRHNHGKPQNGLILKLVRGMSAKFLKLDYNRRQIRRMNLLLISTFVIWILFILVLSGLGVPWIIRREGIFQSSALVLLLTAAIYYWYYRVNRSQVEDLEKLNRQIALISAGNYEIEDIELSGKDFVETERNLMQIKSGIKNAVDKQLKSERMKVDLVANVSHDLKTPLTSIISYIQFLKEEQDLPEQVKDYIKILDEKSNRLNEMVQDVFSISKATSGQLPVNIEILDFGKLLNQTLADMEESISKSNIRIKSDIKEHEFFIKADGQRIYRVCQNLIQNALDYSLEGSRMFITLKQIQGQAVATFKNTSREELSQDIDFSERFVRGDRSRTDGGSGLGLSIAKSFTEACGGVFTLVINGDMFIVTVAFDKVDYDTDGD